MLENTGQKTKSDNTETKCRPEKASNAKHSKTKTTLGPHSRNFLGKSYEDFSS